MSYLWGMDLMGWLKYLRSTGIPAGILPYALEPPSDPEPEYLTVAEAAKKFNIGERTVYRMVKNGMPATRVGRAVRIKPKDLQRFLEDSETILR